MTVVGTNRAYIPSNDDTFLLRIGAWHSLYGRFLNLSIYGQSIYLSIYGESRDNTALVFSIDRRLDHLCLLLHRVQMAGAILQVVPSFYKDYSDLSLFICTNSFNQKFIVSPDYCVAHHDKSFCFVPNCRYHILLVGDVQTMLQKVDALCFTYQHVDCLYTLFKYRFSGNIIAKNGDVFDKLVFAVQFNQRHKGLDRMPSIAKKRLLRKKYKKHLLSSFQKTKSTQTNGSVFAERLQLVKKTKYELELLKIVDCFLDGYGDYCSNLISFRIKSSNP